MTLANYYCLLGLYHPSLAFPLFHRERQTFPLLVSNVTELKELLVFASILALIRFLTGIQSLSSGHECKFYRAWCCAVSVGMEVVPWANQRGSCICLQLQPRITHGLGRTIWRCALLTTPVRTQQQTSHLSISYSGDKLSSELILCILCITQPQIVMNHQPQAKVMKDLISRCGFPSQLM